MLPKDDLLHQFSENYRNIWLNIHHFFGSVLCKTLQVHYLKQEGLKEYILVHIILYHDSTDMAD